MPKEKYITRQDLNQAVKAKLMLMEFERMAGATLPNSTVDVDSPIVWQEVVKMVGMQPVHVESNDARYVHQYVTTPEGVRFWHVTDLAKKEGQ